MLRFIDNNLITSDEVLHIPQAEVRVFLQDQLRPSRAEELSHQLLLGGIPLRDGLVQVSRGLATA
ncbi:MAG TPA: hypothetical protein VLK82_08005 [Candidatus Tectomicrobia bacterium]|nr:hypothetical protein [Candidatus Tectomicrobia bacterium]